MRQQERACIFCGKIYKYCGHCGAFPSNETWRYLAHDETCLKISRIWNAFRDKLISKEEAKKQLMECKPNIDDVLKNSSDTAKKIQAIFKVQEENLNEEKDKDEYAAKTEGENSVKMSVEKPVIKDENEEKNEPVVISNQAKQSFKSFNNKHNNKK